MDDRLDPLLRRAVVLLLLVGFSFIVFGFIVGMAVGRLM